MQKPPPVEVGIMHPTPGQKKTPAKAIAPLAAAIVLCVLVGMVCVTILGVVWMVTGR